MKNVLIFIFTFLSFQLFSQQEKLVELLPDKTQLGNMEFKAEPIYYQGDDLFMLINGGADIYLEYGFKDVISATYTSVGEYHKVEIYQMLNDSAAYGIFSFNKGDRFIKNDIGDACVIQQDFILFRKGIYYVVIKYRFNDTQLITDNSLSIANSISDKIKNSGKVPTLAADFVEISPEAVYMMGNLALSNKYLFDYSDIFEFSDALLMNTDKIKTFILNYPTDISSSEAFKHIQAKLSISSRFIDYLAAQGSFQLKDKKGNTLIFQISGKKILIGIGKKEKDVRQQFQSIHP